MKQPKSRVRKDKNGDYTVCPGSRKRGKPLGHRSIEGLHDRILALLKDDKTDWTAYSIGKELKVPRPTIDTYLGDLVQQRKVSERHIAGITLFKLRKISKQ